MNVMKKPIEEQLQEMITGLIPQLIKDGLVEPCVLTDFSLMIPKGKLGKVNKLPKMSYTNQPIIAILKKIETH
jgi:hypothetical protein